MAAQVGQFGTIYMEEDNGTWWTLPAFTVSLDGAELTVVAFQFLDSGIDISQQKPYVIRATYSDTAPTSGERIFVPG